MIEDDIKWIDEDGRIMFLDGKCYIYKKKNSISTGNKILDLMFNKTFNINRNAWYELREEEL